MRGIQTVCWLMLLVGCTTQPDRISSGNQLAMAPALPPSELRIGLEYLPPELPHGPRPQLDPTRPLLAEPTARRDPRNDPPRVLQPNRPDANHAWTLSATDLAAIRSPAAREALQFVDDLLREDWRRVRREVREPFFQYQPEHDGTPLLWSEQATAMARLEWLHEQGPALLRKPLQLLWRRLPIMRDLELALDSLRKNHLPMTQAYEQAHNGQRSRGRVSVRVRPSDLRDPVEMVFMYGGFRVGSNQSVGKVTLGHQFTEKLWGEVHGRYNYTTQRHAARVSVIYWWSRTTRFQFAYGDDLEFLPPSSAFSLFETMGQERTGFVIYAVHTF